MRAQDSSLHLLKERNPKDFPFYISELYGGPAEEKSISNWVCSTSTENGCPGNGANNTPNIRGKTQKEAAGGNKKGK